MYTKVLNPFITISDRRYTVYISKDALNLLGYPEMVSVYTNKNCEYLAVGVGSWGDATSLKVPYRNLYGKRSKDCLFREKDFISALYRSNNFKEGTVYRVPGRYIREKNMILFYIKRAYEPTKNHTETLLMSSDDSLISELLEFTEE